MGHLYGYVDSSFRCPFNRPILFLRSRAPLFIKRRMMFTSKCSGKSGKAERNPSLNRPISLIESKEGSGALTTRYLCCLASKPAKRIFCGLPLPLIFGREVFMTQILFPCHFVAEKRVCLFSAFPCFCLLSMADKKVQSFCLNYYDCLIFEQLCQYF